ncbi:helix-turn-helix domain-containing protein [Steroidobacter sp. S1-65]|uniref:Helix-turn-helix domain-containing protein n=1 Tax=Steroidobacter gossypii TaxID=2805490 RepID=A0ABS1WRQ2_9GAMM|nr:helix-turn-helix domain-containing protein [Steroidobacter gossypii]MBM0103628.1 helix-turn-helix domain-containing protein [Steroidobacter gossypii]
MENHVERATHSDHRANYGDEAHPGDELSNEELSTESVERGERNHAQAPVALRIPVGTNLADVERWMIFATLQKCGGNKTRAAALLGVSLKTLYNRLNAYRAQGLAMDYGLSDGQDVAITTLQGGDLREAMTEVPQRC